MPCWRSSRKRASRSARAVVSMPPSPVDKQLARVERETGDVAVRPADPLPLALPAHLAADGAGRVLDHRHAARARQRHERGQVARHAQLMHDEDAPWCGPSIAASTRAGSMLKRVRLDVHEHGHRAAVAHGVGGGDERVADRDHLVAGADAKRPRSARCSAVVQLDTAQACGAPTAAANSRSNAATSGPLRHPARQDGAPRRLGVALVEPGPRDRDRSALGGSRRTRSRPPPGHEARQPFLERDRAP